MNHAYMKTFISGKGPPGESEQITYGNAAGAAIWLAPVLFCPSMDKVTCGSDYQNGRIELMAFMRVEKNSNYTVMSNYHLRDRNISLKAKGLLSLMLSLPEEWDFTLAGLAHISKEGTCAIRAAVIELEENGYVSRSRIRNKAGQLTDVEYTIYECPQSKSQSTDPPDALLPQPACGSPTLEKHILENPTLDYPASEKQTQLNTKGIIKDISITDQSNPYQSNDRIPGNGEGRSNSEGGPSYHTLAEKIKQQIDYWDLIERYDKDEINNILSIMVETAFTQCA